MKRKIYILAVLCAFGLAQIIGEVPSGVSVKGQDEVQSATFKSTQRGYSITFPEKWVWKENFDGMDVFAEAPADKETGNSPANISLISATIEENITLGEFFDVNVSNIQKTFKDLEILDKTNVDLNGLPAKKLVYHYTFAGIKLSGEQYFILKDHKAIVITCTTTNDQSKAFAKDFEKTLKSFKLL